eukprot:scaffold15644_cov63-Phaeocystis_antarctica.AAC.1
MLPSSISTKPSGSFACDFFVYASPVTTAMSPKSDVLGAVPSASCCLRIGPTIKRSDSARPARQEPVAIHVPTGNLAFAPVAVFPSEAPIPRVAPDAVAADVSARRGRRGEGLDKGRFRLHARAHSGCWQWSAVRPSGPEFFPTENRG